MKEVYLVLNPSIPEFLNSESLNLNLWPMRLQSSYIEHLQESVMQEFILGSDVMRSMMKVVYEVAQYDVNVLLTGESGTGKEMLAKIIHLQSPRAENTFVPVNCGVLSGLMFEDKLFGHEKGSFTGAIRREKGCFEMAHKGTLFLDEVSEIPSENQVDFLRVLEDFRFLRIGGNELIEVDVRIISATNKDFKDQVKRGLFREDLFYRLHVVPIYIPPLRERKTVIPRMVDHFLNQLAANYKKPKPLVKPGVIDIFCRYDWPGNVRELKNLLERVLIINDDDVIDIEHLPSDFLWHFREPPRMTDLKDVRRAAETEAILDVLYRVRGDKERAAKILRISPRTLRYKLTKYNIKVDRRGEPVPGDMLSQPGERLSLRLSSH
ncbi:MAG: sigma-54-dependent Fis family transcriptional regulator [Desulfobacterales bacterium]|nr:sigma-54-dependent Fis family transcriptional regulator [Desulfobacterales bacterium]